MIMAVFCLSMNAFADERKFTVVLDPGHGGSDPGATRNGVFESHINLAVAKLVGEMLEKHPDIKVAYTRTKDIRLEPSERMRIANDAQGDIFISIHVNAAYNERRKRDVTEIHGVEVYIQTVENTNRKTNTLKQKGAITVVDESGNEVDKRFDASQNAAFQAIYEIKQAQIFNLSNNLAKYIGQELGAEERNMRGVKQQSLYVTWQTVTPSILVEVGYITNKKEREFMASKEGQKSIATGIYNGILRYKKDFDQSKEALTAIPTAEPIELYTTLKEEEKAPQATTTPVPAVKEPEQKKPADTPKPANKDEVLFMWQIFSTSAPLQDGDPRFKRLKCNYYKQDGMYKYVYGSSTSYQEVAAMREQVKSLFPDAFMIALKNGERVDISKVRK